MTKKPEITSFVFVSLLMVLGPVLFSVVTGYWFLTAVSIGLLFGFFLQKGDLCGASAFSEVLLFKSRAKVWGLWICIVVSMLGFALLDGLGLVTLNVKPLTWMNALVGGTIFGSGMVLAGGCVSGCLYKAATGNLNSIVALMMIPTGVALVEKGPLADFNGWMKTFVVKMSDGGPVSLPAVTGLPYWILAIAFFVITMAFAMTSKQKSDNGNQRPAGRSGLRQVLTKPWRPWQAGMAIGILAMFAYLSSSGSGRNYPLGVTHGPYFAQVLMTEKHVQHVVAKPAAHRGEAGSQAQAANGKPEQKVVWWLVLLVGGLMLGSFLSGKMSGTAKLAPKPPEQTLVALFGGLLVGLGAGIAKGCVIGNILSGWALMSVGTILFGVVAVLANWVTTHFYLMGGFWPPTSNRVKGRNA